MLRVLISICFCFYLSSCGVSMGDRIDMKNLQVYYLEHITKDEAIAFAKFWKQHDFIGHEKQTIQLDRVGGTFIIKLIEKEEFHEKALTIPEQAAIYELQRMIEEQVVGGPVEIQISDNTFRPIERTP